ncbi:MAG: macro domain-containing protein [Mobilitalea sp.]
MPFLLIRNDITKVHVDAIVNTANIQLGEGSGTSRAIYLAAGETKLTEACKKIGHCDLGKAVITDGFDLPSRYIIHTVGPVWKDGKSGEDENLYSAYMESMKLAHSYTLESIAFPLISSGNYGFPRQQVLKIAISAISDFLLEHDMLVYLVLYDRKSLIVSKKLFTSVKEYIDDHYVDNTDESFSEYDECYSENTDEYHIRRNEVMRNLVSPIKEINRMEEVAAPLPQVSPKKSEKSLKDLLNRLDETFSQMLIRLIDEKNMTDIQTYRRANIDRRLFSKIRNDINYTPNKKTILAFAIALRLSLDETRDLLMKAGYAFSNSSKFDVIITYFIDNQMYDVFEINEMLFSYHQPILGE